LIKDINKNNCEANTIEGIYIKIKEGVFITIIALIPVL